MFGIGATEIILILAVALVVIGPKKLPDIAKALGSVMGEFKRATNDLRESVSVDLDELSSTPKEGDGVDRFDEGRENRKEGYMQEMRDKFERDKSGGGEF